MMIVKGHRLFMDIIFASLDLFDDLDIRAINCCGTVTQNHEGMPRFGKVRCVHKPTAEDTSVKMQDCS
jgi:hypothetical protein